KELALRIVSDGEGAKKCVLIYLKGAESKKEARKAVNKLSNSLLFKTMLNGEDPNWGRIIASLGASKIEMLTEEIDIYFNNLALVRNGELTSKENEEKVAEIMKKQRYTITIDLNKGKSSYYCYTCDIGHKYIEINADYRT
ncbi:MAG: bifunctional ornithine acetyltransferase/N-acetylglutamate synthase, partial [Deferribacterota bacterium]|nr:bifunctional ornithine acetyltransferase/N-acetylglutamate synthase [Deferribacterota bacterium]